MDEPIALFLDYENLAIGARDVLGRPFELAPVSDVLAERGRVVYRRAYADWSYFDKDRRALTRQNVELTEIPQRMGAVRKNAADIKLVVDAIELCFERPYITTFVIGTGDSDFTPLVQKLRELNRTVIGFGIGQATSKLLPPACDEFFFYERLEGVEAAEPRPDAGGADEEVAADEEPATSEAEPDLERLVTRTLAGLSQSTAGPVAASSLKRAILRKDPTFSESDYGFRGFGELLAHLEDEQVIELREGPSPGDPEVAFPEGTGDEEAAFEALRSVVADAGETRLSGLKNGLRKAVPSFSEKRFGYGSFLQFCKAARARDLVEMTWDDEADDYVLRPAR